MTLSVAFGEHRIVTHDALREPAMIKLHNGHLLLTCHAQADVHFARRDGWRSVDGGITWQSEPRRSFREQAIGQNDDGVVIAPDIYTFEKCPGEFVGSYFRSDDGGVTFSGPHELTLFANRIASTAYPTAEHFPPDDHVLRKFYQPLPSYYEPSVDVNRCRTGPAFWRYLIEVDGRWLATMQCRYHGDRGYRTILVESKDAGRTWHFLSIIAYRHDELADGFCEPVLMVVADGSLLCVLRRGGGQSMAQCRSTDGGQTWTEPEMLPGHGVDPDLCLMSNGVLACTYGRPGLHIMFSPDGCGYSWGYRTQVGAWPSSTYMSIAEVADDELLLVYDRASEKPGAGRDAAECYIGCVPVHVKLQNV